MIDKDFLSCIVFGVVHLTSMEKTEFILVAVIAVLFCFLTVYCAVKLSRQKRNYEKRIKLLEKDIRYDYLTGVLSRRAFIDDTEKEITLSGEGTLLIFDINEFKSVNDTYGHTVGDELIKKFSGRLEKAFGKENVGRLGGDEFVVFFKGECDKEKIKSVIKKSGVTQFSDKQTKLDVTSCCGAAECRSSRDRFEDLYKCADKALYCAKRESSPIVYYGANAE